MPTLTKKDNFQIVDLTRTFAILSVMALHLKPTLYLSKEPWFQRFWQAFEQNGIYGVVVFFTVSGFLITRVLDSRSPSLFKARFSVFYAQRIGRIFPLYFLALFIGVAVLLFCDNGSKRFSYCFGDSRVVMDPFFLLSLLTFNFNWWSATSGISVAVFFSVLWSLSVEEQFYLVYPWLLSKTGNLRNLSSCLGILILVAIGWRWGVYCFAHNDFGISTRFTFGVLDSFALGIGLYVLSQRYDPWLRERKRICLLLCLTGLGTVLGIHFGTFGLEGYNLVFAPTFVSLGVISFLLGGRHLSLFKSKTLQWLSWPGKYCYGNYLFQGAVLYLTQPLIVKLHTALAFGVFVAVTTLLAAFSYHYFEMPVNHWIRKKLSAEKPLPA